MSPVLVGFLIGLPVGVYFGLVFCWLCVRGWMYDVLRRDVELSDDAVERLLEAIHREL